MPRETKSGKTSVIDVLCEDLDGNTFIVEIQKIKQMTFRERMVYYASRVVSITKGMKGDSEYNLGSTYIIAFCCFDTNAFLSIPLEDGRSSKIGREVQNTSLKPHFALRKNLTAKDSPSYNTADQFSIIIIFACRL